MKAKLPEITPQKALVVDDEPVIRLLAREALEQAGFVVDEAEDGPTAVAAIEESMPDLVLLDVLMPGMDGFSVCRHIKELPEHQFCAVVMMTGLDDFESIQQAYDAGATDFIIKPINWQVLGYRARYIARATQAFKERLADKTRLKHAQKVARLGSWEWNATEDVFTFSDMICRIFTLHSRKYNGTLHSFLNLIHPSNRDHVAAVFERGVQSARPFGIDTEIISDDADGRFIHIQGEVATDKNKALQLVGSIQDITERKLAEKKLRRAHDELEQRVLERTAELEQAVVELKEKEYLLLQQSRLAAMGEMISNIAHQWRQPLNTLGLVIQQLPLFYQLGLFNQEYLQKVSNDAMMLIQHMSGTIDDFRNFTKPDKEKVHFNVAGVLNNAVKLVEASFNNFHIPIVLECPDDAVVYGYPNEYAQVILNVLSNAKEAFEARNISKPTVTITSKIIEGKSVVTVSDNAGGIPIDIIGKIFEPHFTTKGPQGTGIGLFIAKNIIEKSMQGNLSVVNTDEGALFSISV